MTPVPAPDTRDARDRNLEVILSVAGELGLGDAGRLVGVITALAESDLYQHANAAYPLSLTLPHDRVSKDQDSLGVYQQRPKWWHVSASDPLDKRVRDLMDTATSARLFFRELVKIPGWRNLDPWVAAQAVQRSSFADGSNYQARMATARAAIAGAPTYFTKLGGKQ